MAFTSDCGRALPLFRRGIVAVLVSTAVGCGGGGGDGTPVVHSLAQVPTGATIVASDVVPVAGDGGESLANPVTFAPLSDRDRVQVADCPQTVITDINAPGRFDPAPSGALPSDLTVCLQNRENVRVVVALNSGVLNGARTQAQQIANVNNIVNDYEKYGMVSGDDFEIVVVGYGAGSRWLLTDAAYENFFGTDPAVAEPNVAINAVTALRAKGVRFFMCQNTMANTKAPSSGVSVKTADLIEGVLMVPAGVTAVVDFQGAGYRYLAP